MNAHPSSQPSDTVLVVDDYPDSADAVTAALRLAGFNVETAYSGQEALKAAERTHPKALLLDIAMPGLDGYEVARQVRKSSWGRFVKLIAITSFDTPAHLRQSQGAGFDYHLSKPVDHATLLALLRDPEH